MSDTRCGIIHELHANGVASEPIDLIDSANSVGGLTCTGVAEGKNRGDQLNVRRRF